MVKATLRGAVLLGLLACSAPGFAEVQNVRVGGEVNVRSFLRKNLRLNEDVFNGVGAGSTSVVGTATGAGSDFGSGEDNFLQQLTAVDVGADLTENVAAQIRLINQRVWGGFGSDAADAAVTDANRVDLSLANVTLKELFYSPLTVTVGRQRIWFGRGFIVGSRLMRGDIDPGQNLGADEFSDLTAFDAIRGTLDLSGVLGGFPLVVDGVYAKVDENGISLSSDTDSTADDVNLAGVNLGTRFDQMNGELETYFFQKVDKDLDDTGAGAGDLESDPQSNTLGLRGSLSPAEGFSLWSELAFQWGHRITSTITFDAEGAAGDDYQAWAANLGLDYGLSDAPWSPTVGAEWLFWAGDDGGGAVATGSAIAGWEPVFRGRFTTLIREFQAPGFYMPAQSGSTVGGTFNNITSSATNQHQLALHATLNPIEDLSVDNRLTWFLTDKAIKADTGNTKTEKFLGTEWDLNANYNYTDDVQMGLIYGIFWPGAVFRHPHDDMAQELVTSVSVKF